MQADRGTTRPRLLLSIFLAPLLLGCEADLGPAAGESTFQRIQTHMFDSRCVSCHTPGQLFATESGLVLHAGAAFDALVGVQPRNARARADGFLLVDPGRPENSFLLHKLLWNVPPGGPDYGLPMPLGGPPPSVGEVEFVRRWIQQGAPRDGDVADVALLDDRTPQETRAFTALPAPSSGYQIHLPPFTVQPRSEREIFVFTPVGNPQEIWVNRFEIAMRPNSHHFILYGFRPGTPASALPPQGVIRDLWQPDGSRNPNAMIAMQHRRYISGAQTEVSNRGFPEGVALRLPPNTFMDLNSHYVNGTEGIIVGEVYANLHTLAPGAVTHEAFPLFLNNADITLPPRQRTTISRTFLMPEPVRIFTLTSHMHGKGERFAIRVVGGPRNGELIYETTSWEHPDVIGYDPPLELAAGEGLRTEVTYNNTTDQTVRFGLTSEDEMSIIIGYYYCPQACGAPGTQTALDHFHSLPLH
jgi:hypothetical protein